MVRSRGLLCPHRRVSFLVVRTIKSSCPHNCLSLCAQLPLVVRTIASSCPHNQIQLSAQSNLVVRTIKSCCPHNLLQLSSQSASIVITIGSNCVRSLKSECAASLPRRSTRATGNDGSAENAWGFFHVLYVCTSPRHEDMIARIPPVCAALRLGLCIIQPLRGCTSSEKPHPSPPLKGREKPFLNPSLKGRTFITLPFREGLGIGFRLSSV